MTVLVSSLSFGLFLSFASARPSGPSMSLCAPFAAGIMTRAGARRRVREGSRRSRCPRRRSRRTSYYSQVASTAVWMPADLFPYLPSAVPQTWGKLAKKRHRVDSTFDKCNRALDRLHHNQNTHNALLQRPQDLALQGARGAKDECAVLLCRPGRHRGRANHGSDAGQRRGSQSTIGGRNQRGLPRSDRRRSSALGRILRPRRGDRPLARCACGCHRPRPGGAHAAARRRVRVAHGRDQTLCARAPT